MSQSQATPNLPDTLPAHYDFSQGAQHSKHPKGRLKPLTRRLLRLYLTRCQRITISTSSQIRLTHDRLARLQTMSA